MRSHPEVFVPVTAYSASHFTMPRYMPATEENQLVSASDLLFTHLWTKPEHNTSRLWPNFLKDHLQEQIQRHLLCVDVRKTIKLVQMIGDRRDEHKPYVTIHGDPTLANLLRRPDGGMCWIDPLQRNYIPGDPHVDLGKLYQSCVGYEHFLTSGKPLSDFTWLMGGLANQYNLSLVTGVMWLAIHLVRLLPYQPSALRPEFEQLVARLYTSQLGIT